MTNPVLVMDLDGTLADTRKDLVAVLNRTIAPCELPALNEAEVGAIAGHGARAMINYAFEHNGKTPDPQTTNRLLQQFLSDYETNIAVETRLYDGALAAMDELAAAGWKFAICTNKLEHLAKRLIADLGIINRFAIITGGDTFERRKPDALPIVKTIEMAGGSLERAVMLGDTATDIDAAHAAAIPAIGVSFGYSEVPTATLGADHVIDHYNQLPALVLQYA